MSERPQPFGPGDRVPNFRLPELEGPVRHFYVALTGKPIVLAVLSDPGDATQRRMVAELTGIFGEEPTIADIFVVCAGPPGAVAELGDIAGPLPVLCDAEGRIAGRYLFDSGPHGEPVIAAAKIYFLDPNQRVVQMFDAGEEKAAAAAIAKWQADQCTPEMLTAAAPVLLLPNVLPPDLCAELIDRWHHQGTVEGGDAGTYGDDVRQEKKRTLDHLIEDEETHNRICDMYMRRITPEITKVFRDETQGYYFDRHVIISYQVEREDFFGVHRDNFTPETRKRTYAISLNLNDDFEGGELRFPEYGPHLYKMPAGTACVFSCSLLHEALPVTKGQRFALTTFLWR